MWKTCICSPRCELVRVHVGASQVVLVVKNPPANAGDERDAHSLPGLGRSPGEGTGKSTPVFLPGEFHGQRSLELKSVRHD